MNLQDKTKAGEIMDGYRPLQKIDYAHHRKTDRTPEPCDGIGAIFWVMVAAVCWIVIIALCASAGYFN